ncbi:hypothetical protein K466DRAFT_1105 [Polyporus arcularius HHB13444]|uniref:Uncharacterized protein n=1 Tax=Polyporus arcularius HHB13444 TaxID=1314778 RepID=A0A5C3Q941_9APHY|nr:hypothetical protein K466DRAFT_1105 [Polyporus arcularius HHB13444]
MQALAVILTMSGTTHRGHASFKPGPLGRHEERRTHGNGQIEAHTESAEDSLALRNAANPCTLHFRHLRQDPPRSRSHSRGGRRAAPRFKGRWSPSLSCYAGSVAPGVYYQRTPFGNSTASSSHLSRTSCLSNGAVHLREWLVIPSPNSHLFGRSKGL